MSKLADVVFEKIEFLDKELSQANSALAEREAQLVFAIKALQQISDGITSANGFLTQEIAAGALAKLPSSAALLQELRATVRQETARECVAQIYPDGNPEIAIRRIKQDFGL